MTEVVYPTNTSPPPCFNSHLPGETGLGGSLELRPPLVAEGGPLCINGTGWFYNLDALPDT